MRMMIQDSQKHRLFFTADLHLGHSNIIKYCNRPFANVHEMNKILINNWNEVVPEDGIVVYCGDFSFKEPQRYLSRLNGRIIFLFGNHDKATKNELRKNPNLFDSTCDLLDLTVGNQLIVCCHYCLRVWNKSHFNSWCVYAHSHGTLPPIGKSWDVGVDNNNYYPLSFARLAEIMNGRPDNPNVLHKERV